MSWKKLEDKIRKIAALKWDCLAHEEHLGGIDFDAVLRPSPEELILIEITKEQDLEKVRTDCAKINSIRLGKVQEGIVCRGFMVTEFKPTNSMRETGNYNHVHVLSTEDFLNLFFNYDSYIEMRQHEAFGSAFNPFTGNVDEIQYIPVAYKAEDGRNIYSARDIKELLFDDKRLILLGDYGTGKSRCVKEVFDLSAYKEKELGRYVFAINLRDHWGASSASEIIAGHLEELGLSGNIDNAMQIVQSGGCILLLDGIDEVGAQVVGHSKEKRISIRRSALEGVRKLIEKNKGGVLATSRSHYFDSDQEMLNCLGLSDAEGVTIVRCADEFSDDEAAEYLNEIGIDVAPPLWLPKKPLVFQVLSTLEREDAYNLLNSETGEFDFWGRFVNSISDREAKIHGSLDSGTVRQILLALAEATREQYLFLGRLSVKVVREVYEKVTSDSPDQAGEQMLMRLCTLGRISPASADRQFVDEYIVDGLRAESLIENIDNQDRSISSKQWRQPLSRLGWNLLADSFEKHEKESQFRTMLGALSNGINSQAYGEIFSVLTFKEGGSEIDCRNYIVTDSEIYAMAIGVRPINNITISNSFISHLEIASDLDGTESNIKVDDCQVMNLYGLSSSDGLPGWISRTEVEEFDNMSTANRIKESSLLDAQVVLLAIIHKIFFQPGSGRKEQALFKGGFGTDFDARLIRKIIGIMEREGLIERSKGDEGVVYKPVRRYTRRMGRIKSELGLSDDPLWKEVTELEKR